MPTGPMQECGCCDVPWKYEKNDPVGFLYSGETSKLNFPYFSQVQKVKLDGTGLGAFCSFTTTSDGLRSMSVDPLTGRVYVGAYTSIYAFSGTGTLLWSQVHEPVFSLVNAIACDAFGNVHSGDGYVGSISVRSWDGATGTPRWSYSMIGPAGKFMSVNDLCCDKAGNIYCAGSVNREVTDPITGTNLFSLDVDGNLRWAVTLPGAYLPDPPATGVGNYGCQSCEINDANTLLLVAKQDDSRAGAEFMINPGTGAIISAAILNANLGGSHWDDFDNYYTGGILGGASVIRKNGSNFKFDVTGVGNAFVTDMSTNNLYGPLGALNNAANFIWKRTISSLLIATRAEFSRGRVGAFGKPR